MDYQDTFKRYEIKYLLSPRQKKEFQKAMERYMVLDRYGRTTIQNIYYDTPNWQLIRTSLEKPVYKEKLRMRSYGVPGRFDTVFVEIKKKFDGVVYKRRITMQMQDAVRYLCGAGRSEGSQISREIDYFLRLYRPQPKVFIAYDREAYAAADGGQLRITFDTDLRARSNDLDLRAGDHGTALLGDGLYLMEIKIPGTAPLWLAHLLSDNGIYPTSFSKYGAYYKQFVLGGRSAVVKKEVVLSA